MNISLKIELHWNPTLYCHVDRAPLLYNCFCFLFSCRFMHFICRELPLGWRNIYFIFLLSYLLSFNSVLESTPSQWEEWMQSGPLCLQQEGTCSKSYHRCQINTLTLLEKADKKPNLTNLDRSIIDQIYNSINITFFESPSHTCIVSLNLSTV